MFIMNIIKIYWGNIMLIGKICNFMENDKIESFEKQIDLLQKSLLQISFCKDNDRLVIFNSIMGSLYKAKVSLLNLKKA